MGQRDMQVGQLVTDVKLVATEKTPKVFFEFTSSTN
jgi:hypothetical protein